MGSDFRRAVLAGNNCYDVEQVVLRRLPPLPGGQVQQRAANCRGWFRAADQVSLRVSATKALHQHELLLGLHSLRHAFQVQHAANVHYRGIM